MRTLLISLLALTCIAQAHADEPDFAGKWVGSGTLIEGTSKHETWICNRIAVAITTSPGAMLTSSDADCVVAGRRQNLKSVVKLSFKPDGSFRGVENWGGL